MDLVDYIPTLKRFIRYYSDKKQGIQNHAWFNYGTDDAVLMEYPDKVVVSYLGTEAFVREWLFNFAFWAEEYEDFGLVHRGFEKNVAELNGSVKLPMNFKVINHPAIQSGKPIWMEGHSRGGPLCQMSAIRFEIQGLKVEKIITVGSPRLGNKRFKENYISAGLAEKTFNLGSRMDPVTYVPPWGARHGQTDLVKSKKFIHVPSQYLEAIHAMM